MDINSDSGEFLDVIDELVAMGSNPIGDAT